MPPYGFDIYHDDGILRNPAGGATGSSDGGVPYRLAGIPCGRVVKTKESVVDVVSMPAMA